MDHLLERSLISTENRGKCSRIMRVTESKAYSDEIIRGNYKQVLD